MVIRHDFDRGLEVLREDLFNMGKLVGEAIRVAVESLVRQDEELARKVIDGDDAIDKMGEDIEDKCMVLIARQQPLARDLRVIGTGLKITTDLERMGDHAYDIARVTLKVANQPLIKPLIDIPRMADKVQNMLKDSLEAYFTFDVSLAERVLEVDDEVDNLYQQVFRELLTFMLEDPRTINQSIQLLFVARYLERIGDHCTNVAEWTSYLVNGQRRRKR